MASTTPSAGTAFKDLDSPTVTAIPEASPQDDVPGDGRQSHERSHTTALERGKGAPRNWRGEDIITFDQRHVWHPYSPTPAAVDPIPITETEGVHLTLPDGTRLIDGMSSWWAAAHGHGHPKLKEAAHRQIETMSHVMFGGLTHEPAVALAQKLIDAVCAVPASQASETAVAADGASPGVTPLTKVFFVDSGSVAVEVAMKMCFQYQRGIGHPERTRLLTWRGGYHGDTFATMSVCDPVGGMHSLWGGLVMDHVFAPLPPARGASQESIREYLATMESLVDDTVAGIIFEPIVQGAGGMRFHDPDLLRGIRGICDRHGLLMIADEIATGFGRTGELFAMHHAGVLPDIMCVGKALTGGFMTLAATLATNEVAAAIDTPAGGGALMHGPTFMGNPLACAVGCAAVSLLNDGQWRDNVTRIEARLWEGLRPLADDACVADVRCLGAIGVVELKEPVDMEQATKACVDAGVWLRPFGKLVYTMPPFVCTDEHIDAICKAVEAVVDSQHRRVKSLA